MYLNNGDKQLLNIEFIKMIDRSNHKTIGGKPFDGWLNKKYSCGSLTNRMGIFS